MHSLDCDKMNLFWPNDSIILTFILFPFIGNETEQLLSNNFFDLMHSFNWWRFVHKYCEYLVHILCKYCANIVKIFCKYCANIVQILWKYCLCKYCANIVKIMYKFCVNISYSAVTHNAQKLWRNLANIVHILCKYGAYIVQILCKYCTNNA